MVDPADVPLILGDAARLVRTGEIVVFGSSALAFWLPSPPMTRDIDLWCEPAERGDVLVAVMGELSWYHERHDAYVEVWGPETFTAPSDWRSRAQVLRHDEVPGVVLCVAHPYDVLVAKLERWEENDRAHARAILAAIPISRREFDALTTRSPFRDGRIQAHHRVERFLTHADEVRAGLPD